MNNIITESFFIEFMSNIPYVKKCIVENNIATIKTGNDSDLIIHILISDSGYPKQINEIINKSCSNKYAVIIAPYISEQTAEICKNAGCGYLDMAGNCYISCDSVYIEIKGNKNDNVPKRALKSVYERSSAVSSAILRTMMSDHKKIWKLNELSKNVKCSIGQVSKVKDFLFNQSLLEQSKDGIRITDPKRLMKNWAEVYVRLDEKRINCYSLDSIPIIESKMGQIEIDQKINCILTGFSGGNRYQPVVRYNKVHALVDEKDVKCIIDSLRLKRVDSGANVILILKDNPCMDMYSRIINNNIVASPVQVYLDCMGIKGRGEEEAEAILEREICK